jgi:hypothetical protein
VTASFGVSNGNAAIAALILTGEADIPRLYLRLRRFGRNPFHHQHNLELSEVIDNQLEFARLDHRQICRLLALEDSSGIDASLAIGIA